MDFGDIDSAKWFAYSRMKSFPLSLGYGIEARKLRRYEKKITERVDYCTVTTQGELEELKTMTPPSPCILIPNGVDTSYFQQKKRVKHGDSMMVFLGRMDYFPNVDAITYFVSEILPVIRLSVPHVQLRIVGSNPTRQVRDLSKEPGVFVTGYVPDVREHLSDATVSVVPLRIARGTQNKILESMAMGIPVVATPDASNGIQGEPEKHLLVAVGPEAFARLVVKVLQNPELQKSISKEAQQMLSQAHSWKNSLNILDNLLNRTTSDRPAVL